VAQRASNRVARGVPRPLDAQEAIERSRSQRSLASEAA
jgi:hypothetical protein